MMKTIYLTILILLGILLQGCVRDIWDEYDLTVSSCVLNGVSYDQTISYNPAWGLEPIHSFSFSDDNTTGYYPLYIYNTVYPYESKLVVHIIVRCSDNEYAPGKKFLIRTPNDNPELLQSAAGSMWVGLGEDCIPKDCDGIAVAYGVEDYTKHNPIGLSGHLEVTDLIDGFYHNRYELSCDTIPPITITDGFFLTKPRPQSE